MSESQKIPQCAEKKKYTFQGKRVMLTIHRTCTEKDIKTLKYLLLGSTSVQVKAFNEIGKTGHLHCHVVLKFDKRVKLSSKKKWDAVHKMFGHVRIDPISSDEHFLRCIYYDKAKKKGGENSESELICDEIGDWQPEIPFHQQCIKFIENCTSWSEVIRSKEFGEYICRRLNWTREIYQSKPKLPFVWPCGVPLLWQSDLIHRLEKPVDNRTVMWVVDRKGGHGKSDLANYLVSEGAFLVDSGANKDIAYAYDGHPVVVFDLCRDTEDYTAYRTMEGFKNKRLFSSKYHSCLKTFECPHVIVFANYEPMEEKLSEDRWQIFDLDDFKLTERVNEAKGRKSEGLKRAIAEALEAQKKGSGVPNNVKAPPEPKKTIPMMVLKQASPPKKSKPRKRKTCKVPKCHFLTSSWLQNGSASEVPSQKAVKKEIFVSTHGQENQHGC